MDNKRIIWLDCARTFAIICVVITHSVERVYSLDAINLMGYATFYRCLLLSVYTIGRMGVPIFFFLTGYLLLDRQYNTGGIKAFYKRNLVRLIVQTEIWIVLYNLFNAWFDCEQINWKVMIENLLFLKPTDMSHMWYMPVVIGIYLFIPFVANTLRQVEISSIYIPLLIVFLYYFITPIINIFLMVYGQEQVRSLLDLSYSGGMYGFCLILGWLVKKGRFNRVKTGTLVAIGMGAFMITVWLQNYMAVHYINYNLWYNVGSLIVVCICAFVIFSRMTRINKCIEQLVTSISLCSFGIYFVHNPVSMILHRYLHIEFRAAELAYGVCVTMIISWVFVFCFGKIKKYILSKSAFGNRSH